MPFAPGGFWKDGREPPVLPAREPGVGGRAHRHAVAEQGLARPGIVAIGVNAHGEIESQAQPHTVQPLSQVAQLPPRERLRHEVIPLFLGVEVLDSELPGAGGGRPVAPISAEPLLRASEMRVAHELPVS